jgi:hypothetical protein
MDTIFHVADTNGRGRGSQSAARIVRWRINAESVIASTPTRTILITPAMLMTIIANIDRLPTDIAQHIILL